MRDSNTRPPSSINAQILATTLWFNWQALDFSMLLGGLELEVKKEIDFFPYHWQLSNCLFIGFLIFNILHSVHIHFMTRSMMSSQFFSSRLLCRSLLPWAIQHSDPLNSSIWHSLSDKPLILSPLTACWGCAGLILPQETFLNSFIKIKLNVQESWF